MHNHHCVKNSSVNQGNVHVDRKIAASNIADPDCCSKLEETIRYTINHVSVTDKENKQAKTKIAITKPKCLPQLWNLTDLEEAIRNSVIDYTQNERSDHDDSPREMLFLKSEDASLLKCNAISVMKGRLSHQELDLKRRRRKQRRNRRLQQQHLFVNGSVEQVNDQELLIDERETKSEEEELLATVPSIFGFGDFPVPTRYNHIHPFTKQHGINNNTKIEVEIQHESILSLSRSNIDDEQQHGTLGWNSAFPPTKSSPMHIGTPMARIMFYWMRISHEQNEQLSTPKETLSFLSRYLKCHCCNRPNCSSPWSSTNDRYILNLQQSMHSSSNGYATNHKCQCQSLELDQHCRIAFVLTANKTAKDTDGTYDEAATSAAVEKTMEQLRTFRTGDASPSFYLYSLIPLPPTGSSSNSYMLVYRHLPPRPHMQNQRHDLVSAMALSNHEGRDNHDDENTNYISDKKRIDHEDIYKRNGSLWEAILTRTNDEEEDEEDVPSLLRSNAQEDRLLSLKFRPTAPPYLNLQSPHHFSPETITLLHSTILNRENLAAIRTEALSQIPQWSPWPEEIHYNTETSGDWRVFPLCHTFPAHDLSQKKWIDQTCHFVPQTTKILKRLGGTLRTALFSRLGPRTTLNPHTGWKDLANHVVRAHLPLVVPEGCGTWVDGCIEMHRPTTNTNTDGISNNLIVFDDSKVHRAFNYSDEERVVLILDLVRPDGFPLGTAVGGNSRELDSFIQQLT